MDHISVKLDWVPVQTPDGDHYSYPMGRPAISASDYEVPAVYRWALRPSQGKASFLIGETDNLRRRLGEYATHRGKHHSELRAKFQACTAGGGLVIVEVLRFEPFGMNGLEFSQDKLDDPFVRGVLENLCCADLQHQGFELLNDTKVKQMVKKLRSLDKKSPGTFKRLVEKFREATN